MTWQIDIHMLGDDVAFIDDVHAFLIIRSTPYESTVYFDGLAKFCIYLHEDYVREFQALVARNIESVRHYVISVM